MNTATAASAAPAATRPPETSVAAAVRDGRLLLGRNVLRLMRNPVSVTSAAVIPLVFLLGFSAVLSRSMDRLGIDYAQYLPPIVVVQAMFFTAISSAYFLAEDRISGMLERCRSLPVHRWSVVLGRVGADAVRALVSMVVVLLGAAALGFRFHAGWAAGLAFAGLTLMFAMIAAAGCALVGLRARDAEAATSALMLPYLPLLMLSTGFVPLGGFPGWIQPFVEWQPVSLTVDALRALSTGGPTAEPTAEAVLALAALGTLFVMLAARAFRTAR